MICPVLSVGVTFGWQTYTQAPFRLIYLHPSPIIYHETIKVHQSQPLLKLYENQVLHSSALCFI